MPLGYMAGLILATNVAVSIGWRNIFFITGGLGILLAALILLRVKDIESGSSEPELEKIEEVEQYKFEWHKIKDVLKKNLYCSCIFRVSLVFFHGIRSQHSFYLFIRRARIHGI